MRVSGHLVTFRKGLMELNYKGHRGYASYDPKRKKWKISSNVYPDLSGFANNTEQAQMLFEIKMKEIIKNANLRK